MIPSLVKDGRLDTVKPLGNSIIHPDATGNNDGTDGSTPPEGNFTFSRGSNLAATRVDVNGLIEKGRENLLTYSNDFSNGNWTKTNLSVASSNGAWEVTDNTTSGSHYIYWGGTTPASTTLTLSVEAKAGSVDYLAMRLGGFTYAFFDVANGTLGAANAAFIDTKIEATSNGFYKCSATILTPSSGNASVFYPTDNNGSVSYTGTGAVAITIKDAQLESSMVATDYIETGASTAQAGILEDLPRLDYSGGASCPSLLLEPIRTNLFPDSEYFGDWSTFRSNVSANQATSPEGLTNAYKLIQQSGQTSSGGLFKGVTTIDATTYTYTFFAKEAGYGWCFARLMGGANNYYAWFDLSNGVKGNVTNGATSSIEPYGNGWYRCSITFANLGTLAIPHIYIAEANSSTVVSNPDGVKGINIYGAQLEQGSYPTSYIPTYGSAVTRSNDSCVATSVSDLIGQEQGTMLLKFKRPANANQANRVIYAITDGSTNNRIRVLTTASNALRVLFQLNGNTIYYDATLATALSPNNTDISLALRYKSGDIAVYINGTEANTSTNTYVVSDTMNNVEIGYTENSNIVSQALIFKTPLTNAELAALTA
jgi:hypothetical protein